MCYYWDMSVKIVSILLIKLSECPNTDTLLCYCNYLFSCMHIPSQMPQKVWTFGNRLKAIFKSNPSKHGRHLKEKDKLEERNRETCSRLEQQRDEAVRMREELTQQVARLEERFSEAQKLQSTMQGQCTHLFDQLQRNAKKRTNWRNRIRRHILGLSNNEMKPSE